jgi:hypothetical protein
MMRSPFLVYMSHTPGDLLLVLRPPRLQTPMIKLPFFVFHPVLLWLRVIVMMRLSFRAYALLSLLHFPSLSSPCSAGLWPMPWIRL